MPKAIQNTVEKKMPLQLANSQRLQAISTLEKGYIYVQNKKVNYKEEISLLIYIKDENYDFVDELFTLPKESYLTKSVIEFRENKSNRLEFSREDILREIFKEEPKKDYIFHPLSFGNYQTVNVSPDGNCAFWAVLQARDPKDSFEHLNGSQSGVMQTLRQNAANLAQGAQADSYFVEMLRTPNQWNAGIHGGIGLEALHFIAIALGRRIVLIENDGGNFSYWDSNENNLVLQNIPENAIDNFLADESNKSNTPLFIYHEGNHFQAIIKK